MNLFAFIKYGDRAASVRQRFLQYSEHLRAADIDLKAAALLENSYLDTTFSDERHQG